MLRMTMITMINVFGLIMYKIYNVYDNVTDKLKARLQWYTVPCPVLILKLQIQRAVEVWLYLMHAIVVNVVNKCF